MKRAAVLLSGLLLASSCGVVGDDDGSDGAGGGGLVMTALQDLPLLDTQEFAEIRVVDVAAVVELTGDSDFLIGPNPVPRDEGGLGLVVIPPEIVQRSFDSEAFAGEAGFAPTEIERIAEISTGFDAATVLTGPTEWGGAAEPHVDGVRTIGTGDDFGFDVESPRVLDPLGRPLRVAESDGRLLATFSTPLAEGWVDGTGGRYDEVDRLTSMAAELDRFDVVSAVIFPGGDFLAPLPRPELGESIEDFEQRIEAQGAVTYVSEPFDAIGFGNAIRNDQTIEVVTYRFLTDASAEAAMTSIEEAWTTMVLLGSGEPISSLTQFESIERNGSVVTVVAVVPDDRVSGALRMFMAQEAPFAYG